MNTPIVIRGTYADGTFTPDEPLPDAVGRAELVIVPIQNQERPTHSAWDAVGKLPPERQRNAEDINKQVREERDSWGDR